MNPNDVLRQHYENQNAAADQDYFDQQMRQVLVELKERITNDEKDLALTLIENTLNKLGRSTTEPTDPQPFGFHSFKLRSKK